MPITATPEMPPTTTTTELSEETTTPTTTPTHSGERHDGPLGAAIYDGSEQALAPGVLLSAKKSTSEMYEPKQAAIRCCV